MLLMTMAQNVDQSELEDIQPVERGGWSDNWNVTEVAARYRSAVGDLWQQDKQLSTPGMRLGGHHI